MVPAVANLNASDGLLRKPVRARVLVVSSVDYGNGNKVEKMVESKPNVIRITFVPSSTCSLELSVLYARLG